MFNYEFQLEYVCSLRYVRGGSDLIGATPAGFRAFGFLAGGEITGPKIQGKVRPQGGGDWGLVRGDDVIDIDARIVIETHDGAMIYTTYPGLVLLPEGGSRKMQEGALGGKSKLRTAPRMITAHPAYAWVNRTQFLGIGQIDFDEKVNAVTYDYYAVA
jgi:hypothetical protein